MLDQEDRLTAIGGTFGPWQAGVFLLVALVKVPSAWHMLGVLFKAPSVDFWCVQPKNLTHLPTEVWISLSHPIVEINNIIKYHDPCEIYDIGYEDVLDGIDYKEMNIKDFAKNLSYSAPRRPCQQFQYDNSIFQETVVTEWHLVCDRKILVSVSQSFYLTGILVGGLIAILLIPRVGPRWVLLSGAIIQIVGGTATAFAPLLEINIALRFTAAFGCAFMFTGGYVICHDVTWGKSRILICAFYEWFWSFGVMSLPLLCLLFGTKSWRLLQIVISVPTSVLLLVAFFYLPESPRWLLENDRSEEAEKIVRRMAAVNRRPIPDNQPLNLYKDSQFGQGSPTTAKKNQSTINCMSLLELFQDSNAGIMIPLYLLWATTIVTYYGALLNVKNLGKNLFLNIVIAGFAEMVGVTIGALIILYKNRQKWTLLGGLMLMGGLSCIASWFLLFDMDLTNLQPLSYIWWHQWVLVALGMSGRIAIACSLTLLQLSSAELFPKDKVPVASMSTVTFARIFLISAPFIGYLAMYGECVSLTAFGSITVLGGLSSLLISHFRNSPTIDLKLKMSRAFMRRKVVWTVKETTLNDGTTQRGHFNQNFIPE